MLDLRLGLSLAERSVGVRPSSLLAADHRVKDVAHPDVVLVIGVVVELLVHVLERDTGRLDDDKIVEGN